MRRRSEIADWQSALVHRQLREWDRPSMQLEAIGLCCIVRAAEFVLLSTHSAVFFSEVLQSRPSRCARRSAQMVTLAPSSGPSLLCAKEAIRTLVLLMRRMALAEKSRADLDVFAVAGRNLRAKLASPCYHVGACVCHAPLALGVLSRRRLDDCLQSVCRGRACWPIGSSSGLASVFCAGGSPGRLRRYFIALDWGLRTCLPSCIASSSRVFGSASFCWRASAAERRTYCLGLGTPTG